MPENNDQHSEMQPLTRNHDFLREVRAASICVTHSFCGHCGLEYVHTCGTPWDPRCCDCAIKQTAESSPARLTLLQNKMIYERNSQH